MTQQTGLDLPPMAGSVCEGGTSLTACLRGGDNNGLSGLETKPGGGVFPE